MHNHADSTSQGRPRAPHRTHRGGEDGQAFVEFALVLPLLLAIIFAIIGFGDTYWKYQQLSAAVSEGARKAIVSRTDADPAGTTIQATQDAAPNLSSSDLNVDVGSTASADGHACVGTPTWDPGSTVCVHGSYPAHINVIGMTVFDDRLDSVRVMRVEQ
jgi:Flp pilus assembly protein TadG